MREAAATGGVAVSGKSVKRESASVVIRRARCRALRHAFVRGEGAVRVRMADAGTRAEATAGVRGEAFKRVIHGCPCSVASGGPNASSMRIRRECRATEGNLSFVKRECVSKDACTFHATWNVFL
ncbi:hypothetical protein GD416_09850 [Burkholderia sp. BE24]|uniref:hypothetical protein n=1 Tax=unclassified Burkholderia TaxID=2613784 RepID=UPI00117F20A9|nr:MULTISPECIES: hypothetical protein [unclassified Burkholderia]MPV56728.1 hypothetical protein [Burkholderia sp. BE24]